MIYLCLRPDPFRYRLWLQDLKRKLDPAMADFNYQELPGRESSLADITDAAYAMPMMDAARIVAVTGWLQARRGSGRKPDDAERAALLSRLAQLPAETWLVFAEPEMRGLKNWQGAFGPLAQTETAQLQALAQDGRLEVVPLDAPHAKELPAWIQKRCRAKQMACADDAVRELGLRAGHDLQLLDTELDKMAAYADGAVVSVEDVRAMVTDYREDPIWGLADAVFRQERSRALSSLAHLLDQGLSPIQILATLGSQVGLMAAVRMDKAGDQDIASQMKVSPYALRHARRKAARYSARQIVQFSDMLLEADYAMKSQPHAEAILEELIGRFVTPTSWTPV